MFITTSPLKLVSSPNWWWVMWNRDFSHHKGHTKTTKLNITCSDSYLQDSWTVPFHLVSLAIGLTVQGKFLLQQISVQSSKTQLLFIFLHDMHYLHPLLPLSFPYIFLYLSQEVPKLQTGCGGVLLPVGSWFYTGPYIFIAELPIKTIKHSKTDVTIHL